MRKLFLAAAIGFCCTTLPALAAEPSAASIERLLEVTQAEKLTASVLTQVDVVMARTFEQAVEFNRLKPEEQQQARLALEKLAARMRPILAEELGWHRMKPVNVDIYRSTFTQDEVDGLIAFYESPAGRALVEKMPQVMQRSMALLQQRMGPMMQKVGQAAQEIAAELKAQQAKTPAAKKKS